MRIQISSETRKLIIENLSYRIEFNGEFNFKVRFFKLSGQILKSESIPAFDFIILRFLQIL